MADDRPQLRRSDLLLTVYVPAAMLAFGQGLLLTTLPLYLTDLGFSYSLISLIVASAALGTLLTDVPAGSLVSRLGLKQTMLIGSTFVGVGTIALAFVSTPSLFVTVRVVAGVGTAMWGLSRHAFVASSIPPSLRGRAISVFGGVNRFGTFAGPAAGGVIAGWVSYEASFVAAGLMAGVAIVLALAFIPATSTGIARGSGRNRWSLVGKVVRTNGRDLGAAGVAQTFAQMIRAGRQLIIPLYGADVLHLDPAQIGLTMTVSALLDVSMFVPAGFLMDRFGRKTAAVPSFAVMSIGVAMIPFVTSQAGLMAVAAIIGFGNGLGAGTMMTLGADLAPEGAAGEFLGVWRLIGDTGAFIGPLAVGVLASVAGLEGSAFLLAIFGAIAALTLAFMVKETRQLQPV